MTYRQKAESLFQKYLGMSPSIARDVVRLIEQDEYIPCMIPQLNAPRDLEDWDAEIPEGDA